MKDKKEIRKLYNSIQEDFNNEIVKTEKYKKLSKKSDKLYEELKETISEKDYNTFSNFIDSYTEQMTVEVEEYFIKGFSIANNLRDESLSK